MAVLVDLALPPPRLVRSSQRDPLAMLAGMDNWATHVLYLMNGRVTRFSRVEDIKELQVGPRRACQ